MEVVLLLGESASVLRYAERTPLACLQQQKECKRKRKIRCNVLTTQEIEAAPCQWFLQHMLKQMQKVIIVAHM